MVVSLKEMVVVEVVETDDHPVELCYVDQHDQLWVGCWGNVGNGSQKTLEVIREAGRGKKRHSAVHPQPIQSHFDRVADFFLPHSKNHTHFGYVSHTNSRSLYKMDLKALKYTKSLDLTPWNCVPQNMQFSDLCN